MLCQRERSPCDRDRANARSRSQETFWSRGDRWDVASASHQAACLAWSKAADEALLSLMRYPRPLSVCSETRLRPSFLRTTPARKPRTECCCQSVSAMIAAIVVPAGARSIAMMRACLVSGRIAVFEGERASRLRVLDLLVDREMGRAAALGFDLGLVMESSEVRATPSAAPPQPRRANHPAGRHPMWRLGHTPAGTATLRSRTKASHF